VTTPVESPDERALREHLRSARFRAGVAADRWRLISPTWPEAIIAVSAAERPASPAEFALKLALNGYPNTAPTGGLWDIEINESLSAGKRPKGDRVAHLFRVDWEGGLAMYAPWDRKGLEGHPGWLQSHPEEAWNPSRDLTFILEKVHEVLNANDYLGI
jgi:hypothetical protein